MKAADVADGHSALEAGNRKRLVKATEEFKRIRPDT
jgi:hypothetical protein